MNPDRVVINAAASLCLALIAAGCASGPSSTPTQAATPTARYASALAYPDRLRPVADDSTAYRWIDPAANMRKFDKLLIERIRVQLDSDSTSVDANDLKTLTDYFHQSLVKAVDPPYPVVNRTRPGVLRVRITIVDLVSTKPEMSVVVLLTPYATLPDLMSGAATGGGAGSAPYLGRTAIAAQFIDGETNTVVAEYAETSFGRKYVLDTSKGTAAAITTGAKNYLDAYSTWAYAKQAFDQWSARFRTRLDQLSGRQPAA
jgi:hypothetical protein